MEPDIQGLHFVYNDQDYVALSMLYPFAWVGGHPESHTCFGGILPNDRGIQSEVVSLSPFHEGVTGTQAGGEGCLSSHSSR